MPIMPNLRSVAAQVHGKSRSIGSHRNLFTLPNPIDVKVVGLKIQLRATMIKSFVLGVGVFGYSELYKFYKYRPTLDRHLEEEKLRLQRDVEDARG